MSGNKFNICSYLNAYQNSISLTNCMVKITKPQKPCFYFIHLKILQPPFPYLSPKSKFSTNHYKNPIFINKCRTIQDSKRRRGLKKKHTFSATMRSPTSNVGYMDNEGMNRGSATNERNASEIARAAKTVFASSVVTLSHPGKGPLFSPEPPSPPSSPPPSSLFPPLFSNSRTGFDSSVPGPSVPLHWRLHD